MGRLFIVSTPIGNLGDITLRAIETLKTADLVAAEDTRHTRKLFSRYGIGTPLISYCGAKERSRSEEVLKALRAGKSVALVSDAGTPGISDPGYYLVTKAVAERHEIVTIPGPSAIVSALTLSALPTMRFVFEGFLPPKEGQRRKRLEVLKGEERTIVFYESPKRVLKTLREILDILGDRGAALARELTKIHEEVVRGKVSDIIEVIAEKGARGEMVLVLEGATIKEAPAPEDSEAWMRGLLEKGGALKEAAALAAERFGISKKAAYDELLRLKGEK